MWWWLSQIHPNLSPLLVHIQCLLHPFTWVKSQFSSVAQSCLTLWDPINCSTPASLSITHSRSSLKLMSIESVMPSSCLILCRPLLLLPPIPPSIRLHTLPKSTCPKVKLGPSLYLAFANGLPFHLGKKKKIHDYYYNPPGPRSEWSSLYHHAPPHHLIFSHDSLCSTQAIFHDLPPVSQGCTYHRAFVLVIPSA